LASITGSGAIVSANGLARAGFNSGSLRAFAGVDDCLAQNLFLAGVARVEDSGRRQRLISSLREASLIVRDALLPYQFSL
jgi:hypothetical protein